MNSRAKGMKNEKRAQDELEARGYQVIRLWQPRYAPQGAFDMIAVKTTGGWLSTVLWVQVRTNAWHNLAPVKDFKIRRLSINRKEAWMYIDGKPDPKVRCL